MAIPIVPSDLDPAATVTAGAALIVDDGVNVQRATPIQLVDAAIPLASQAEAETGTDNAKRVTPLRVAQAIASLGVTNATLTAGLATKEPLITAGTTSQYFRGDKTFQTLNKAAVGLSAVDNTSDAAKPVSTATQTALNLKTTAATLAASGGAALVGISGVTGATTAQGFLDLSAELVANARNYGALGNNVNDTTALQAYHDALPSVGGEIILRRNSIYKTATINITKSVRFGSSGTAENNTQVSALNATGHVLSAVSAPGFWLSDVGFIAGATRTAGAYVNLQQVYRGTIRDFRMDSHFIGVRLNDVSALTIENGSFTFPVASVVTANGGGILVGDSVYVGKLDLANLYFTSQQVPDIYSDTYQPTYGIQLVHSDNLTLTSCFFAYQGTAVSIAPSTGKFVTNMNVFGCTFDYSRRQVLIAPAGGQASHINFFGGLAAFSHLQGGICIDSTNGECSDINFYGMDIINHVKITGSPNPLNDSPGIAVYIKGTSNYGIRFKDCPMSGSEVGIQADACNWLEVDGCDFGDNGTYGPASKTGLLIASGVKGRMTNCRFKGVTTPFINLALSTFLMDEWQGYTPVVTSGTGAITAYTASGRFRTIKNRVEVQISIAISNNGTGGQDLRVTAPPIPIVANTLEGFGRTGVTGRSLQTEELNTTTAVVWDATNAYPGGVGAIRVAFAYEIVDP